MSRPEGSKKCNKSIFQRARRAVFRHLIAIGQSCASIAAETCRIFVKFFPSAICRPIRRLASEDHSPNLFKKT